MIVDKFEKHVQDKLKMVIAEEVDQKCNTIFDTRIHSLEDKISKIEKDLFGKPTTKQVKMRASNLRCNSSQGKEGEDS